MAQKSTVAQLDPRIKEAVDQAIREERATIDEIVALIQEMGGEVSRSAVGRYAKNAREAMEKWRDMQRLAAVWKQDMAEGGEAEQLVMQMLLVLANDKVNDLHGKPSTTKAMDIMLLGKAIKDMVSARKTNTERILRARKEAALEAAAKVEKVAKRGGLSAATVDQLKREILGIAA